MVDGQRARRLDHGRHGRKRHQLAGGRAYERLRQAFGILLVFRIELQNDRVVVAGRIDRGDLSRPVRVIQGGADLLRGEAERRRLLLVDVEDGLRAPDLQIRGYVLQARQLANGGIDQRREAEQLLQVAGLQGVLVEALARARPDIEVLHRVQENIDTGDGADLPAQLLDHLDDGRALIARLELDVEVAAVDPEPGSADA